MNPHSLPASELNQISSELIKTESPTEPLILSLVRMVTQQNFGGHQKEFACVTCHSEHRGKTASLTHINDEQCQVCHKNRFKSFSVGHPEISGIVFQRRPGIIFTHLVHKKKYYPEDNTPFLCADCHVTDVQGQLMQSPNFESGCLTCHQEQIQGKGFTEEKGIPVFNLPGLDLDTLMENDIGIGQWPEDADQELSPFMLGLLSNYTMLMQSLPLLKELDLLDLSNASEEELEAVKRLAWTIKQLFSEIIREGHKRLEEQLQSFIDTTPDYPNASGIIGLIPKDVIDAAQHDWFPNLVDELKIFAENNPPPISFSESKNNNTDNRIGDINESSGKAKENEALSDDLNEIDHDDFELDWLDDELELEPEAKEAEKEKDDQQDIADDEWVSSGGWYRAYFSIFYRPSGHADRFLEQWLTLTSRSAKQTNRPVSKIFKSISHPKTSPGQCTKCHSVDKHDDAGFSINWLGKHSNQGRRNFTKFSHKAHFSLIEEKGCVTCHAWDTENKTKLTDSYKQSNPFSYAGNFNQLSIDACARCHTKELAGDACLTCHNYHVGQFPDITLTIETQ